MNDGCVLQRLSLLSIQCVNWASLVQFINLLYSHSGSQRLQRKIILINYNQLIKRIISCEKDKEEGEGYLWVRQLINTRLRVLWCGSIRFEDDLSSTVMTPGKHTEDQLGNILIHSSACTVNLSK